MKLFPNFTSTPFDYLLIPWVTNYVRSRGFFTCLSSFYFIDRELHSLKSLELKFGLSSDFSDFLTKHLLESFLMCSFVYLGFLLTSSFIVLKLRRPLATETYERLPWQFCTFTLTLKLRATIKE